jgi:thymidylate synthase
MIIAKRAEDTRCGLIGKILREGKPYLSRFGENLRCEPSFVVVEKPEFINPIEYEGTYDETYFQRVEELFDIAADKLRKTPFTRRISFPIWRPRDWLCKTPPAITEVSLLAVDEKLNATAFIRSLDAFNYFTSNFDFLNYVLESVLSKMDFKKGSIGIVIAAPHIYERDLKLAEGEKEYREEIFGVTEHGAHIVEDYMSSAWHSVLEAIFYSGRIKRTEWEEIFVGQAESKFIHRLFVEVRNPYELQIHDKATFTKEYGIEYAHEYMIHAKSIDEPVCEPILRKGEVYTYAERARHCERDETKVDQLYAAIQKLREDKFRRDCYVGISREWDLKSDEPPCLRGYQFIGLNDVLAGIFYMRSNDAYGAMHANMFAFSTLTQYLAELTGFAKHRYYHFSVDAHIYAEFFDVVKEILEPKTPSYGEMAKENKR